LLPLARGDNPRHMSLSTPKKISRRTHEARPAGRPAARAIRRVCLIAHDNKKPLLLAWVERNRSALAKYQLCATGTTGGLVEKCTGLKVHKYKSGPMGGDLQIGGQIAEGLIDFLVFFWDPMFPHPHEPDVRALLRVATVYDIPVATNLSSADVMISAL
jgi:methylglyoxal synthase